MKLFSVVFQDFKIPAFPAGESVAAAGQFCNDILVIEDGRAVQRGSHEELVGDTNGIYYTLWHTQAQYYQQEAG